MGIVNGPDYVNGPTTPRRHYDETTQFAQLIDAVGDMRADMLAAITQLIEAVNDCTAAVDRLAGGNPPPPPEPPKPPKPPKPPRPPKKK